MCYYEIGSQCEASSNRLCVLTPAPLRGQASPGGYAPLGTRFARLGRFPMGRAHPQGAVTRLCVKHLYTFYMFYTAEEVGVGD